MLGKVIAFELKYRFSKPMTYIFMAMMVFQAIWYAKGTFDYYINDATNFNAAAIVYRSLAGGGMLMLIVIAIITGTALFKDIEHKTAETFYTLPVNDKTWLAGKFIAAYIINLAICLAYAMGFAIIQYTGIAEPDRFGPVPWGQMAYGYLIYAIPNMLIWTTVALSLVVFFRNMASSYLGVFILAMLFMVAESTRENAANIVVTYLLDPLAYTYTVDMLEGMSVAEKNYGYIPLQSVFFINRAIWMGICGLLTLFAFRKFSFKYFITKATKKRKPGIVATIEKTVREKREIIFNKTFSHTENIKKLFRLSVLEFKNTVRPTGFKIIMGILSLMFFLYNILWNADYYIQTDTLPITSAMTLTRLPNGVFILLLLVVFAGELLFKERTVKIWQITDAFPIPSWLTYLSKFAAMVGVSFIFALILFASGLLAQVFQGFFDIEWGVYFSDLFSWNFGWYNYILAVALAFFIGSLTANRFASHIFSVFVLLSIIVFADIGVIEQMRFMFPFTPGIEDYSEMNAYGIYGVAAKHYTLMWSLLGAFFMLSGIWFWNRGAIQPLKKRFSLQKTQLHFAGKISAVVFIVLFFVMQSVIVKNEQDTGNFKTEAGQDAEDAEYEKRYKYIDNKNQPLICGLDMFIDISPENRIAGYEFKMPVTNVGNTAIDSLHINMKDFAVINSLMYGGTRLVQGKSDEKLKQFAYALPAPMQPGDTIMLEGNCSLQYVAYSSIDPQPALVFNGSFLEHDILPHIGYNADRELTENRTRTDYGLHKLESRMDAVTDLTAIAKDAISPDALWHSAKIAVRTDNGQTAYTSGIFTGSVEQNGKTYQVFEQEQAAPMNWHIGCARYETHSQNIRDNLELEILYDHRHTYNILHMANAVKEGIAYLETYLGTYPYSQLRIAEIPFYNDEDFYASPNSIAISEKHCWTADGEREKDLSYIYYTLCREIVKQWITQHLHTADVQGAEMLLTAIPEAYALHFVNEKFGKETLDIYFDKKTDRYGKGRGNEPNTEPSLVYADGIDYLEANKGAMELYKAMETVGLSDFSELFLAWKNENSNKNVVFKDLYRELYNSYPVNKREELKNAFERVLTL